MRQRNKQLKQQWFDLADYYQLLNEPEYIESVMIKITEDEEQRDRIVEALRCKRDGEVGEAKRRIDEIMLKGAEERMKNFIEQEKLDCSVLLSEWEEIAHEARIDIENDNPLNPQRQRVLTLALQQLEPHKRQGLLSMSQVKGDKYEYERGMLDVMNDRRMDGAKHHAL